MYKKLSYRWQTAQRVSHVGRRGTISYVRYGFLLVCYSIFVPKMRRLSDIRLRKCRDLENLVMVPSRLLIMPPFDRALYNFLWCSIVTMALCRVVSDVFNIEIIATLKSRSRVNQGHWMWYHSKDWAWFPISVL